MNATHHENTPQRIIEAWTFQIAETVKQRDIDAHMQLVSAKVQVYGMPSKAVILYNEWRERREVEFKTGELQSVSYAIQRIITSMPRRITFSVWENLLNNRRKVIILDKTIILEKEQDNIWRVVEESIKKWKVKKYNLN
jgi:hypothetical protein